MRVKNNSSILSVRKGIKNQIFSFQNRKNRELTKRK